MNGLPVLAPAPLHEHSTFMVGTMKFVFTREKLPVAMKIATPTIRPTTVDDRRSTLTFPGQPNAPEVQPKASTFSRMLPLILIALVAALGGVAYWASTLK
jgi:hypothetical protein